MVSEEFLQYIWENRLFDEKNLYTEAGEVIDVIKVGKRNSHSGPDFFDARIQTGNTVWAGNIEIHLRSSDWEKHNHHTDKAYNNVILHVVEEHDAEVFTQSGEKIATLQLRYPGHLRKNYQELLDAKTWIPCQNQFYKADPVVLRLGFHRLMIERLENKTEEIIAKLERNRFDWNETFYQVLARMFGFRVNAAPFEMLAKSLPLHVLARHKNDLFQLEAMLFGNSGLLNDQLLGDDYYLKLREEYSFLRKKYGLKGIESHLWKFMRLRPGNFPTIRISQFAALIHRSQGLFSQITETENLETLKALFTVRASEYWDTHYSFNKATRRRFPRELGEASVNLLIINVVIPFLFVFGEKQNKHFLKNRALDYLEQLPAESNSVVEKWRQLGITCKSALDSQALLQLKNNYCEKKKCLNCRIGVKLIQIGAH